MEVEGPGHGEDGRRDRRRRPHRGGGNSGNSAGGAEAGRGGKRPFRGRLRTGGQEMNKHRADRESVERARREHQRGRRGSRGGRNRGRHPRNIGDRRPLVASLTQENIRQLASLESDEKLVNEVDRQLKAFQEAIGDMKTPMPDVVKILSRIVCLASKRESKEQRNASKIIAEVLSERSDKFHYQLKRAVQKFDCTMVEAENFCSLFESMLTTLESDSIQCLPFDEIHETVKRLTKSGTLNPALLKRAEEMCEIRDKTRVIVKQESESDDGGESGNSKFKLIPILPEWKEIKEDKGTPPEVRPNKVDTPYKDWMEYYDIQFRLIREDFIAPLRRGVAAFLQGDKGKKNRDVKTYSAAKIVSQVTTKDKGICFVIQFDVSWFCRINYNWDQSKRLIFGSLLCFIPMGKVAEDAIIFATVADRDSRDLKRGKIMVQFEGDLIEAMTHCRNGTEFEVVESNSYFGATSPILRSIQKAEVDTMPFTKQLIEGECESVSPPTYLRNKESTIIYNLSCLHGPVKKRRKKPPLMIEVLKNESWEAARDSELDSSQLNAIQTALTQEIAVIQGPPGTGKTYIGLKIVEALLENRKLWDPRRSCPILVMCYTNHALDQFLEGIIDTECCGRKLEVIRVGGRCKNEKVDEHNLTKIRRNVPRRHRFGFNREFGRLKKEIMECNPEKLVKSLNRHFKRKTFLPLFILQHVAHPYHYYQLTQMAQCSEQQGREVEVWLDLWQKKRTEAKITKNGQLRPPKGLQQTCVPLDNMLEENKRTEQIPYPGEAEHMPQDNQPKESNETKPIEQNETEQMSPEHQFIENTPNDEEVIEIEDEATLAQNDRMDDDDIEGFQRVEAPDDFEDDLYPPAVHQDENHSDEPEYEGAEQGQYDIEDEYVIRLEWVRKKNADNTIQKNLFNKDHMDDEEVDGISNASLESLSIKDRWRLYNYWEEQRYNYLQEETQKKVERYSEKCRELAELRQQEDRYILEKADVVGMTTTGAAKYQHILHRIKPKIVIVEEAAEVLEAHIVSALSAGTQHLILIGDHKQLRPKPNEYVLATEYNLSISLFERLVMKQMSQATLEIQHRMRPEIAQLVCPHVYEKLFNHESVEKYPDIRGISKNLFFVCHTQPESENPNLLSYQNDFEAKYIVGLCAHLLRLGYSPSQITILTPYVGQLLLI